MAKAILLTERDSVLSICHTVRAPRFVQCVILLGQGSKLEQTVLGKPRAFFQTTYEALLRVFCNLFGRGQLKFVRPKAGR